MYIRNTPFSDSPENTGSKQHKIPRTIQEVDENKVILILDLFNAVLITNDVVVTHASSSTTTIDSPFNTALYRVVLG